MCNFQLLEVMGCGSETQFQVVEVKMFILQHTSDHLVLFTQHTNLDFTQIHIADSLSGGLASI